MFERQKLQVLVCVFLVLSYEQTKSVRSRIFKAFFEKENEIFSISVILAFYKDSNEFLWYGAYTNVIS